MYRLQKEIKKIVFASNLYRVGYVKQCGGLDNVATVLAELAEKLDAKKLLEVAGLSPISWSQRLGFLLDMVDAGVASAVLADYVENKIPVRTPLLPASSIKGTKTSNRWKVFINAEVESEV